MCEKRQPHFDTLKLTNVFTVLSSGKIHISDDAILHMLLDVIQKNVSSHIALNSCGLEGFVSTVLTDVSGHDITIVTFCVQLLGWLSSDEERYMMLSGLLRDSVGQVVADREVMGNMSVVTALYNSLEQIASHSHGLLWILDGDKDLVEKAYRLLSEGSSIFVKKAVTAFLGSLLVQASRRANENKIFESHVTEVIGNLHTVCQQVVEADSLKGQASTGNDTLVSQLQVLDTACLSCATLTLKLVTSTQLVDDIIKTLEILNGRELQLSIDIVKLLLPRCGDTSEARATSVVKTLLVKGELKRSQNWVTFCLSAVKNFDKAFTNQLLILPVKYIRGEMYQLEAEFECHMTGEVVQSNMKSKCQLTDILCHSVDCLRKCQMFDMAVCRLFNLTCHTEALASCHVVGNRRLQRACMEYFTRLRDAAHGETADILVILVSIIEETDLDSLTYTSCLKCLQEFLPQLLQQDPEQNLPMSIRLMLASKLQDRLSALHWELRDSTLEFLGKLIFSDNDSVSSWIKQYYLQDQIWQCVSDGNSYVRATAINTMAVLLTVPQLWRLLTEDLVVGQILEILETDTEAFPRRSAAAFLHVYYRQKVKVKTEVIQPVVMETMIKAADDFDWEVKHKALSFLKSVIDQKLSSVLDRYAMACIYTRNSLTKKEMHIEAINKLNQSGVFTTIFRSVDDYDQKVSEKACYVLENLGRTLRRQLQSEDPALKDICQMVSCSKQQHTGHEISPGNAERQSKRLKMDTDQTTNTVEENVQCDISYKDLVNAPELISGRSTMNNGVDDLYRTVQRLLSFDISEYSHKFSSTSDYETNPDSLLDDILSYGEKPEDDNIVDCY